MRGRTITLMALNSARVTPAALGGRSSSGCSSTDTPSSSSVCSHIDACLLSEPQGNQLVAATSTSSS